MAVAGSPGNRWMNANSRMDSPNSTGMTPSRRRTMNRSIWLVLPHRGRWRGSPGATAAGGSDATPEGRCRRRISRLLVEPHVLEQLEQGRSGDESPDVRLAGCRSLARNDRDRRDVLDDLVLGSFPLALLGRLVGRRERVHHVLVHRVVLVRVLRVRRTAVVVEDSRVQVVVES